MAGQQIANGTSPTDILHGDRTGLAWGLTVAAASSTLIGASYVLCVKSDSTSTSTNSPLGANPTLIAVSLGLGAGAMIFVAVAELFGKSEELFAEAGYSEALSKLCAVLSFFGGCLFVFLTNLLVECISPDEHHVFELASTTGTGWHKHDDPYEKNRQAASSSAKKSKTVPVTTTGGPDDQPVVVSVAAADTDVDEYDAEARLQRLQNLQRRAMMAVTQKTKSWQDEQEDQRRQEEKLPDANAKAPSPTTTTTTTAAANAAADAAAASNTTASSLTSSWSCCRRRKNGAEDKKGLYRMGLKVCLAVALHNFPEGLACFLAAMADGRSGFGIAFGVIFHNLPEGLCVAAPILMATNSKAQALGWAALAGLAELLGGLIAFIMMRAQAGQASTSEGGSAAETDSVTFGALFGMVNGIVVMITCVEFLPTMIAFDRSKGRWASTLAFIVGMAFIAITLVVEGLP